MPIPREHGAWGLLLQPFFAAAVLSRQWNWLLVPALGLVLLGFALREPLIVLARRYRSPHAPASASPAIRWASVEAFGALLCFLILASRLSLRPLVALATVALLMTIVSVWFAVRNWQRSVGLQVMAAAGLGCSAFVAALACRGTIPPWAWWLWGFLSLHGIVAVFCVHARLDMRIPLERRGPRDPRRAAIAAIVVELLAGFPAVAYGGPSFAAPIACSVACSGWDIWRLSEPETVREPLRRVGFRTLAISIAHTIVTLLVLLNRFPA